MNIYIHVEIAARELDSKILLAAIAASKGHDVLVSNVSSITTGIRAGLLPPGIFHTKSLTPSRIKIARHQEMVDKGFKISSIDEEAALIYHGYDNFAAVRYSKKTIKQASAVFGWGTEDTETLASLYPSFQSRFHNTGCPRADLWTPRLAEYWNVPEKVPNKPYLLVASNMQGANNMRPFHETIKTERRAGYYLRDPEKFARRFFGIAEDYRRTFAFIEAIRHLAESNSRYNIVLRPHPVENIEAWEVYLEGIPNVHVIREGSITAWVKNAFAVMHNGCTTALEATIAGKSVVTYLPFEQKYDREIANELGVRVDSLDALSNTVDRLYHASQFDGSNTSEEALPDSVAKKIYLDDEELAAEKMVKVWESLDNGELSRPCYSKQLQAHLKVAKVRGMVGSMLRKAPPGKFERAAENYKFPPMDADDIPDRVGRLVRVLSIDRELECRLLSERTILIRPR